MIPYATRCTQLRQGHASMPKGRGGEPDPFSLLEICSLEFKHDWRLLFRQRGSLPQGVGFLCERVFFKIKGHAVGITQFMIHIIKNSV